MEHSSAAAPNRSWRLRHSTQAAAEARGYVPPTVMKPHNRGGCARVCGPQVDACGPAQHACKSLA